jgi:hypothetical protein
LAQEERLNIGRFKARPAVPEWSDFDDFFSSVAGLAVEFPL